LRFRLHVSRRDDAVDYSGGKRFLFAVVDLDRAKDYPLNFVCMLPLRVGSGGKEPNTFMRVFGDKSLEMAKKLLVDALEAEDDSDVKGEIERRLKLLEPKPVREKVCVSCGKIFQAESRKGFKQKFCPECMKKKFASRK
jgi:hypothetical protein